MKIGLIICGQARILNRSFLNYLDKENIDYDVYIHYWEPINNSYTDCGNIYNSHEIYNLPENLNDEIIKTYKPLKIKREKQIKFEKNDMIETHTNSTFRTISNFYGCYKGFNIIDNKEIYTHFIKIRFDFEFTESYTDIKTIDNNSIYFLRLLTEGSLCDIFWLVPKNKTILFDIYNFIYETDIELDNISEHITMIFLENQNLTNDLKKYSANFNIDRSYIKKII